MVVTSNMKLSLYGYPSCPFCGLVLRAIETLGSDVEVRNVMTDAGYLRELMEATGRQTVPCLRIESEAGEVEWMHESRDIVEYLRGL